MFALRTKRPFFKPGSMAAFEKCDASAIADVVDGNRLLDEGLQQHQPSPALCLAPKIHREQRYEARNIHQNVADDWPPD